MVQDGKILKPILYFLCETWTTTARHRNRVNAMEVGFLRKIENKINRIRTSTYIEKYYK